MDEGFINWITEELEARGWNYSELARRAGVVPSTVSMTMSQQKNPGLDFCLGVAKALKVPPEDVLRRAGLLPAVPEGDARYFQELRDLVAQLSPEEREELLAYAYFRYRRAQEKRNPSRDGERAPGHTCP
jgi:transcriptional regulator with XRE-family HTH domain